MTRPRGSEPHFFSQLDPDPGAAIGLAAGRAKT